MAYSAWSVVFGEQWLPSAAKWNILGTNDASFNDGTGIFGLKKDLLATDSNPYKFYVYRNAAQTPGVNGKIRWDTEVFDTNNNFDSTTNYRYTAPVTGFYHLIASAGWGSTGANVAIGTQILKNGTTVLTANRFVGMYAGSYSQEAQCHWFGQLTAGDYVEVFEGAGATYALVVGNAGESFFSGYLVCRT